MVHSPLPASASPPVPSPSSAGPGRIDVLDLIRGVAILGTLGTNIWLFTDPAGPQAALNGLNAAAGTVAGNVEAILRFLSNGKFLALLTLLFGVGLELQYRSARRKGARWPGWYLWRAALLLVEGLLHYVLIFEYDVLMAYAITSMAVAYLIGRSDRAIRGWIIALATLHTALVGLLTADSLANGTTATGLRDNGLFTSGSYPEQVMNRLENWGIYRAETILIIPMSMLLFLLGAMVMRAGVFDADESGRRLRGKLMLFGFGIGVPLNVLTTFSGPAWFMVDRYMLPPIVALGLLGLLPTIALTMNSATGPLRHGFTAVGRTSLSCYVFQNLLGAVLCYGWGFGLAAQFDGARPWWVIGAWAGICATFMILATLWMRRFSRGPLETAWHWAFHAPQRALARRP